MVTDNVLNEKRKMTFFVISCISLFLWLYFLNRDIARIGFYLLGIVGLILIYKDRVKDCGKGFVLKSSAILVLLILLAIYLGNLCCGDTSYYSKPFIHLSVLFPFVLLNLLLNGWMRWLLNASLFYVVVCIVSYALSDYPLHSAKYFESHYAVYLLLSPITYVIFNSNLQAKSVLLIFAISGIIIGLGAIAELSGFASSQFWLFDEYPNEPNLDTVGIGLGMNSIHFGIVCAALLAVVVANLSTTVISLTKIEVTLSVISILFLSFALAMSGARSGWVSLPFIFFIPFVLSSWSIKTKLLVFMMFILGFIIFLQNPYVQKRMHLVTEEIAEYMDSTDVSDPIRSSTSIGLRFELWRAAWEVFRENPVIGVGPGNYRSSMQGMGLGSTGRFHQEIEIHKNPHSLYFKALEERGVMGIISTLLLLVLPGLLFFMHINKSQYLNMGAIAASGLLVVIVFSLGGLTIGSLHKTELSVFYILFCALFFGMVLSAKDNG